MRLRTLLPASAALAFLVAGCGVAPQDESSEAFAGIRPTFPGSAPHPTHICAPFPKAINLRTEWDSISSLWKGRNGVVLTVPYTPDENYLRVPQGQIWYLGIDPFWEEVVFVGYSDTSFDYTAALNWTQGSCHPNCRDLFCGTAPSIPPGTSEPESGTDGWPVYRCNELQELLGEAKAAERFCHY